MDLIITIDAFILKANLMVEKAPETCKAILEKLPIKGSVIQARWSGEAVWLQMDPYDIQVPQENATSYPCPGQILYYPGGVSEKEILIPYGSSCFSSKFGLLPGNHFATIVEGVEKLESIGRKVLWEGGQSILIDKC